MGFSIEQLMDLVVNAIPTAAILGFLSYLIFGGGLASIIQVISSGWLFG